MGIAILLISHGDLAKAVVNSAYMIMGEQENVTALGLYPGDSPDHLVENALKVVNENKELGMDTLVLVDLYGGTPYNSSLRLLKDYDLNILAGLNLVMAIESFSLKDSLDMQELIAQVSQSTQESIKLVNRKILFQN